MMEIREAVGVFNDPKKLDAAVAELEVTAFPRPDISVLDERQTERKYGAANLEWLEDNAPRAAPVRPEEKTIGAGVIIGCCAYIAGCASAILAMNGSALALLAAIASGSVIGAALGTIIVLIVNQRFQNDVAQQLRNGGLLLWVRTPDPEKEELAQEILRKHGARRVHIHSAI